MPSLFSLARKSTDKSRQLQPACDEFGRGDSGTLRKGPPKDRKKNIEAKSSGARTLGSPNPECDIGSPVAQIPDGSFLSLSLDRPPHPESADEKALEHDYGYLSYERHVILGLDEAACLVDVVAAELTARCLTAPFIFSALALDISSSAIKRLIRAFLNTCVIPSSPEAERRWREEARFAGPHELGMCIRWGLARVVRVVGGQTVRGLISWEHYVEFRDSEAAFNYPATHFATFLTPLSPILRTILWTLLNLLIRYTTHSASSGHTPPTLSSLFGPLLFGLGPGYLSFQQTYIHYLRAVNATEHIILAFIRWQDAPKALGVRPEIKTNITFESTLGVPTRLKDWIRGYPSMLPFLNVKEKQDAPQARRGARVTRVVNVRRNVCMYSPDLVKTAASWAACFDPHGSQGLASWEEWERVAPSALKLQPRYSEGYKKRMNLPPNFHPYTGPINGPLSPSATSSTSTSTSSEEKRKLGLGIREGDDRFRTLTELKWGEFETMGFGAPAVDEQNLQFNLTESERMSPLAKRTTLNWNDFSAIGFNRTDVRLSTVLQFSTPVTHTMPSLTRSASITKKLKKTQRALPPSDWDSEPVLGPEEMIEEAFLDVFCDLVYGGGWMDIERCEKIDRDCNWALVEFKSLPFGKSSGGDPRTATTVFLFEEFVPLEYRQQLAKDTGSKRRLPYLFSPSGKSRPWKPAATLNGRPHVVGHDPRSATFHEAEFEGMLRFNNSRILSFSRRAPTVTIPSPSED